MNEQQNPSLERVRATPGELDPSSWSYQEQFGQRLDSRPRTNPRSVTASANVNPLDDEIRVDSTSASVTMTLETAVGCDGRRHLFKKTVAANSMIIACTGSETIDGSATVTRTAQYDVVAVISNGTTWDLEYAGAATFTGGMTILATQATTSGTTVDITIPAGAKRVTVMFNGVSISTAVTVGIQLGDAGGVETTGYIAGAEAMAVHTQSTTTFPVYTLANAATVLHGSVTLSLYEASTFTWVSQGSVNGADGVFNSGGRKALSAELTTVRIMGGTFDAGAVSASWE